MLRVDILINGDLVGKINIPESYKGDFWRISEINACNYVYEENGLMFIELPHECEECCCNYSCPFFGGRDLKLPKGATVTWFD